MYAHGFNGKTQTLPRARGLFCSHELCEFTVIRRKRAEVSVSHNTPVFDKHPDTPDLLIDIPAHSHRCEEVVCRPTAAFVCVCARARVHNHRGTEQTNLHTARLDTDIICISRSAKLTRLLGREPKTGK